MGIWLLLNLLRDSPVRALRVSVMEGLIHVSRRQDQGVSKTVVALSLAGLGSLAYWVLIGRSKMRRRLLAKFHLQDTIEGASLLEVQKSAKEVASLGEDGEWIIGTSPNGSQHGSSRRKEVRPSVCFQGSGCVIVYHIGVAQYLQEHFDLSNVTFCAASGGSIVAAMLALDLPMELAFAENCRLARLSRTPPLGPFGRILDDVAGAFENILASWTDEEVEARLRGRLVLSLTHLLTGAPRLMTSFGCKRDLVDSVWSSMNCLIFLCRFRRVQGEFYVDGGLTNNSPVAAANTVRVSPTDDTAHVVLEEPPSLLEFFVPGDEAYMEKMHMRGYEAAAASYHVWLQRGFKERKLVDVHAAKSERAVREQEKEMLMRGESDSRVSFSW